MYRTKLRLEVISNFLIKNDFEIISTGGTLKALWDMKIPAKSVEEVTKFPEIMDGRVKTLHPNIHAGILARNKDLDILDNHNIKKIDVLIVNFYPFEKVIKSNNSDFSEAIENIDVGGPAMVRAAAKNFENCCVLVNPNNYDEFIELFDTSLENNLKFNKNMSLEAFEYVANYDIAIANYLDKKINKEEFPKFHSLKKINDLRYGENPHQKGSVYQDSNERRLGIINSKIFQGKSLSYNNIVDGDTALSCVSSFVEPACVIVKHANPCGVSSRNKLIDAYEKAFETDKTSAFGGVIAFNKEVDEKLARKILENQFVEIIISPSFSKESLEIFKSKKDIRIVEYKDYQDINESKNVQIQKHK